MLQTEIHHFQLNYQQFEVRSKKKRKKPETNNNLFKTIITNQKVNNYTLMITMIAPVWPPRNPSYQQLLIQIYIKNREQASHTMITQTITQDQAEESLEK